VSVMVLLIIVTAALLASALLHRPQAMTRRPSSLVPAGKASSA
jgi:hypothetical protein